MDYKKIVGEGRVAAETARLYDEPVFASILAALCDAVEALERSLEERTCPDCGKPMVCGGWCVNDPPE